MVNFRTFLIFAFVMGPALPGWAAKKEPRGPSPGVADKPTTSGPSSREEKERSAKRACLNRDPDKGVELLTDLYVDTNDPTYIFNQGRCYEQNDRCQDAIVRFREFLRKTSTEGDRKDAQKHIADCEALLAKRAVDASPAAVPVAQNAPVPNLAPPAELAPPTQAASSAPMVAAEARPVSAGTGMRVAGVATMVAGAVVLVGAVALNLKHNGMITDLKADYSGDDADSAKTYKTLAAAGYGVGAACLVGGAALYWLGVRAGAAQVGPALVAGNAGVMIAGGF